jgi:DNA polymerase III alpha subunit (gram-positive type)
MKSQNFIALDLELNNKQDGTQPKIIQVGIAVGNPTTPDNIATYSWYIDPQEPITPFITELTGITDKDIQSQSVSHAFVAQNLTTIVKTSSCFVNPITWGGSGHLSDSEELKNEFDERNIEFPHFGRRIIDVKTLYVYHQLAQGKNTSNGLKKAMRSCDLEFIGEAHRASVDAHNTLRFFFYFLNRQSKINQLAQAILS